MKKEIVMKIIISALLLVIVALSFTQCVKVIHIQGMTIAGQELPTSYYTGYSSIVFSIVTILELRQLWFPQKQTSCKKCFFLNIFATVSHWFVQLYWDLISKIDLGFDSSPTYNRYEYGILVYVIYGLSFLVSILYIYLSVIITKNNLERQEQLQ